MLQGDLQAPGLEEREYPGPSAQSPGLLPQAPWSQVSTSLSLCSLCGILLCVLSKWRITEIREYLDLFFSVTAEILHQGSETERHTEKTHCSKNWKTTAAQPPVSLRRAVCLCVCEDNVLIITSRRNNHSDSVHWQGGGTLMSSNECWGIYSSRVTCRLSPHDMGASCQAAPEPCTFTPHLLNICSKQTSCRAASLSSHVTSILLEM